MAGEMLPEDKPKTSEEREKSDNLQPRGDIKQIPIECDIVNMDQLDALSRMERTGKPIPDFRESATRGIGGAQFIVTLKLAEPLTRLDAPLTIDVRYTAKHGGILKPSGLFLYKQTASVTFRSNAPNHGNEIQQFYLQTIRFSPDLAGHDAEITIETFYQDVYVGKEVCPITLQPGS